MKKIIYEDNNQTKVIFGEVIKETEFLYDIRGNDKKDIVTIGKRAIIKISDVGE